MTFRDLNLSSALINALDDLGYTIPTSIQSKVFSEVMSGKDVLGIAQTGTGKTFAYLLPILRLWKFSKERNPQILILVPTRELVIQVQREVEKLTKYMNIVTVGVYGGGNISTQAAEVELGLDIVVGTPGRLMDLALRGSLKLKNVKQLVIDEVDEMLDLGFRVQLSNIFDLLPKKRQNLLFSATLTEDVDKLLDVFFNHPLKVEAAPMGTPLTNIQQLHYDVPNFNTKINLLEHLLLNDEDMTKVLVFAETKAIADFIYNAMEKKLPSTSGIIHSNKSQNTRFATVKSFQNNEIRALIATDIIARGIDISEVTHVINFDLPSEPENYIHRIGRTGRADKKGIAISFVKENEKEFQLEIETLMQYEIPAVPLPDTLEISNVLVPDEMPVVFVKNVKLKIKKIEAGSAFHEKSDKRKKVNKRVGRTEKMQAKYGKPQTRGMKRKPKKK
jgi:ATP-dependent RNA helicase RhlE